MNKAELIDDVAQRANMTKKAAAAGVDAMLDCISRALAEGDKVQLTGFGTFEVRQRDERRGRNPQTGEEIIIPARASAVFRPGKLLKDAVK
ncbi:MAG TPA: HU family DNA-binding protein [Firmicutes bacterium]|jgi:DNA-binding protein HU-beta|nr:HU family DNA-binding protein [Bacillota bacterium]